MVLDETSDARDTALSSGSLWSLPWSLRGATPELSFFRDKQFRFREIFLLCWNWKMSRKLMTMVYPLWNLKWKKLMRHSIYLFIMQQPLMSTLPAGIKLGGDSQNSRSRGQNFALNWAQGEVGVSLQKTFFTFFFFFFFFLEFSSNQHTHTHTHTHTSCGDS